MTVKLTPVNRDVMDNHAALKFYEKTGFVRTGKFIEGEPQLRKDLSLNL